MTGYILGIYPAASDDVAPQISDKTFNINDGYTNGQTVGTVSLDNAPSPDASFSITAGNTNTAFAIDSSTSVITVADELELVADNNYSLTVQASNTAGSDTATVTVNVAAAGADTSITTITVTNADSSDKTNEIVTFGIPTAPDAVGTGQVLRLYDDNGSGAKGDLLDFQVDGVSTDMNSKQRMARISAVIPSLGGSATRKLFLESSSSAVPTGTAITASDILATSFRALVSYDIGGTTYSFDTDDALSATDTFSKTDYQCVDVYSGPLSTEYLVSGPPKNAGTAHASGDGLRTYISIRAFKAGTGAVASNPITLVQFDVWTENGDLVRSSPAHYYYGFKIERSTSLSDGTLISSDDTDPDGNVIRYSYPRSQPAATLTATGATSTGSKTWTLGTGSWANDILGAHIVAGSGGAVVTARNSSTSITVYVYAVFAATSFTSTNWTIEGIGHHYNVTAPRRRGWVGAKPTNVVAWGDNSSAITATDRTPLDYLVSTFMYLNASMTYASVTHDTTKIDLMKSSDGSRRPLTFLGPNGTFMGEVGTFIGNTGWADTIGPLPVWCMQALAKNSIAGRRRIFENAEYFSTWQFPLARRMSGSPTTGELGVWPRSDNGTDYSYNASHSSITLIAKASASWWPYDGDNAHHSASSYVPYLLTGDIYWLTVMQRQEAYVTWALGNPGYNGAGVNRTAYGDASGTITAAHMGEFQTRAKAWSTRDALYAAVCTPDSISEKVVNSKTYLLTRVAKHWAAGKAYGPDDVLSQHPGTNNAPEWCRENGDIGGLTALSSPSTKLESPWMLSFNRVMFGISREVGMQNTDAVDFQTWMARSAVAMCAATGSVARNYMSGAYWVYLTANVTGFTTRPSDWETIYQRSCQLGPVTNGGYGFFRTPTGTITLSSVSVGTGVTMTFANDFFSGGGTTFYAGGYVRDATQGGIFKITSISTDGLTLTGDITTAFGGTSLTAANIRIPGPHRVDDTGADPLVTSDSKDYVQFLVAGARVTKDAGILTTEMDDIITYNTGRSAYVELRDAFAIQERA